MILATILTPIFFCYILVLEYCDEKSRIIPLWTVMFSYSLSSILAPVLAMHLTSWKILLLLATLPNLIVIIADLCKMIPESIRWLIYTGKHDEAMNILLKIADWHKVRLDVSTVMAKKSETDFFYLWKSIF